MHLNIPLLHYQRHVSPHHVWHLLFGDEPLARFSTKLLISGILDWPEFSSSETISKFVENMPHQCNHTKLCNKSVAKLFLFFHRNKSNDHDLFHNRHHLRAMYLNIRINENYSNESVIVPHITVRTPNRRTSFNIAINYLNGCSRSTEITITTSTLNL